MHGFVARQPIFDGRGSVFAYELLFRPGPENVFAEGDRDQASAQVIRDSLEVFGFDALTGGRRAFVNVTRQVLVSGLFRVLPPERTVVELLETVEADEEVVAACAQLKADGYLLALDDFVLRPALEPLLPFADFLKLDFLATSAEERAGWFARLGERSVRLLAEKVETRAHFEQALAEGFSYFQGYYLQRPEMVQARIVPPFKLGALRILGALHGEAADAAAPARIEELARQEGLVAERLLADLNASLAATGDRPPITSVRQARELLGAAAFRRWASLVALACLGEGRPPALVATSLVRARQLELVAEQLAQRAGGEPPPWTFLVGLLSSVDALVGRPLPDLLSQLSLPPAAEGALLRAEGPLGDALALVLAYERGQWSEVALRSARLGLGEERVPRLYRDALAWTHQLWRESPV